MRSRFTFRETVRHSPVLRGARPQAVVSVDMGIVFMTFSLTALYCFFLLYS